MTAQQREVLAAIGFDWAASPDNVWTTSPYHVDGLHADVTRKITNKIRDAADSPGPSPIGLVLQGPKGIGKTHLLGSIRRQVQQGNGYFVLVSLTTGAAFWDDVVSAYRTSLMHADDNGDLQLPLFLRRLCAKAAVPDTVTKAITGVVPLTVDDLDTFSSCLRNLDPAVGLECAETARALVLYASNKYRNNRIGESFLNGFEEEERGERREWDLRPVARAPLFVAQDISRLLALTGPSVIAVDQLDNLVSRSTTLIGNAEEDVELNQELSLISDGLMELRERTRRTLSLLACLPGSWGKLRDAATDTVMDRFEDIGFLGRIANPELGRTFVERWLGVPYRKNNFTPPHPTWPIAPSAFEDWDEYTPRELQQRIQHHLDACLDGQIHELTSFATQERPIAHSPSSNGTEPTQFAVLDRRFAELRAAVDVLAPLDEDTEDKVVPGILSAGLRSWINEVGNDDLSWNLESPPDDKSTLHAGIHRTTDEKLDIKEHWSFRAIASVSPLSALHRLRSAMVTAGARAGSTHRHLVLIRNVRWSKGAKTQEELENLAAAGGRVVPISEDDLRTFGALEQMLAEQPPELRSWLVARRPASSSALLREILPPTAAPPATPEPKPEPSTTTEASQAREGADSPSSAPLWPEREPEETGARDEQWADTGGAVASDTTIVLGSDRQVAIELASLRKHVVVFAGSGSGKTVLIRRIIEECALRGVSAIVLDPNNDLARLGDEWPTPPPGWGPGDAAAAREYLADTEVVVWTPGRSSGRPLSFHPLPDFTQVLDDEDEFTAAVEASVATLAPQAKATGNAKAANRGKAVLREALTYFARDGGSDMAGFIDLLSDLPDGVSQLNSSHAIAVDLAENLKAAMVNDPLFAGSGTPVDPAVLFTPTAGKRARVSVISFVGLQAEEQRQGFVNQLQLAIFGWIKRHPAGDRPLGGLLVMDEAQTIAPSGRMTASTYSTIMLASQARKYGLGLLFATQAPRGLHNQITGNATTQFFGRLNSQAHIVAANDMARAKGSNVSNIAGLDVGQFYVAGETFDFRRMRSPMCLSHHPASPLPLEEVLERARKDV